jgi:hypothetical protein
MVVHKLDRRVAVPPLRIGTEVLNVLPSRSFIFGNGGSERATPDRLDCRQRVVAIIPN